jgi:hypothetical protein
MKCPKCGEEADDVEGNEIGLDRDGWYCGNCNGFIDEMDAAPMEEQPKNFAAQLLTDLGAGDQVRGSEEQVTDSPHPVINEEFVQKPPAIPQGDATTPPPIPSGDTPKDKKDAKGIAKGLAKTGLKMLRINSGLAAAFLIVAIILLQSAIMADKYWRSEIKHYEAEGYIEGYSTPESDDMELVTVDYGMYKMYFYDVDGQDVVEEKYIDMGTSIDDPYDDTDGHLNEPFLIGGLKLSLQKPTIALLGLAVALYLGVIAGYLKLPEKFNLAPKILMGLAGGFMMIMLMVWLLSPCLTPGKTTHEHVRPGISMILFSAAFYMIFLAAVVDVHFAESEPSLNKKVIRTLIIACVIIVFFGGIRGFHLGWLLWFAMVITVGVAGRGGLRNGLMMTFMMFVLFIGSLQVAWSRSYVDRAHIIIPFAALVIVPLMMSALGASQNFSKFKR